MAGEEGDKADIHSTFQISGSGSGRERESEKKKPSTFQISGMVIHMFKTIFVSRLIFCFTGLNLV